MSATKQLSVFLPTLLFSATALSNDPYKDYVVKSTTAQELKYLDHLCWVENKPNACYKLGIVYERGMPRLDKDMGIAFDHYFRACWLGSEAACFNAKVIFDKVFGTGYESAIVLCTTKDNLLSCKRAHFYSFIMARLKSFEIKVPQCYYFKGKGAEMHQHISSLTNGEGDSEFDEFFNNRLKNIDCKNP